MFEYVYSSSGFICKYVGVVFSIMMRVYNVLLLVETVVKKCFYNN